MTGHRPFSKLLAEMSPQRQARVKAKTKRMQQEMFLAQARRLSGMTQQEVADILGITQPSLSKMEGQQDMRISTLNRLVQSMGGTLELIARLPQGEIRMDRFTAEEKRSRRTRRT